LAGSGPARPLRGIDPGYLAALGVGIVAFAVYRMTLQPGLAAWDTAEAQAVLPVLGTMHPTGFPAYVVIGWLASIAFAPLGSPAFTINLLSAVLVASAVGMSVLVTRRLGVPVVVAIAAAIGFAVSPIVWRVAVAADAHALHAALLVAEVVLLLRWESFVEASREAPDDPRLGSRADRALVVAAAVFGVALANHALTLLLIPAVGLFVLAVDRGILRRPRLIAAALGTCLAVVVLFYLELPLRAGPFRAPLVYGHPETWGGFWDVVAARQFQGDLGGPLADLGGRARAFMTLAFNQFGLWLLLVPSGLVITAMRRPRYALLSGVALLTTCLFAASYSNAAIERYYIGPVFFAWTWLAVLGGAITDRVVDAVVTRTSPAGAGSTGRGPADRRRAAGALVGFLVSIVLLLPAAGQIQSRWRVADLSNVTWPHAWLDEAFTTLEPNAVVLSWWSYSTPLWYGQFVEHRRPDVWVVDDRTRLDEHLGEIADVIEANLDTRPVYVIPVAPSDVEKLGARYVIELAEPPGNLYRVVRRQEAP
jgi:hypothetical protein